MRVVDVACAIILKDHKILVAQRSDSMTLPLKWEFPGGKVNLNESEEECLQRELKEELNITVKIKRRLDNVMHDYGNFIINLIPFIVVYEDGNLQLTEHLDAKWFSRDELFNLDWAPADIHVLNNVLQLKFL